MESFGNFLKSLSESLNFTQEEETTNLANDRRDSNFSESGYGSDSSRRSSESETNNTRAARMNAILNQAREDDDEEFETRGMRNLNRAQLNPAVPRAGPNNPPGLSTGAIVGLAALAIGGYAIGKALFAKNNNFPDSPDEIIKKIKEIEKDAREYPVVGFDCQWSIQSMNNRRNKIALIQIASHKGNILLIQINKLYSYPEELKLFLRNRNIIKAGIETLKDARYLLEDYGLVVSGTFDLRFLAENTGNRPESLAKLAHKILGYELNRDWELVASDWNKEALDENQIAYAEKAAKASIELFVQLIQFVITKVNRSEILNYCSEYLDRIFIYYSQNY